MDEIKATGTEIRLAARVEALEAELAEARKDSRRYRYLRDHGFQCADVSLGTDDNGTNFVIFRITFCVDEPANWPKYDDEEWRLSEVDAAIDATIAREAK